MEIDAVAEQPTLSEPLPVAASADRDEIIERILDKALALPGRVPRYVRITEALEGAIRDGVLPPGTIFPPEPELARRAGISRQPLNEALVDLARRGLVTRRRRTGTVVSGAPVDQPLDRLYSFMASLDGGGKITRHLDGTRMTRHAAAATVLNPGEPETELFELSRRYVIDNEPFAIERLWLPRHLGERLPVARLAFDVVYDLLREFCDVTITHADERLRLTMLNRADAAALRQPSGRAAFLIERTAFSANGPVEVRRTIARGDRVRFHVHLPGLETISESS